MCFSSDISILTYITGVIGCYLLFNKESKEKYNKIFAIFLFFVIQMQLIEYFFWNNQECNDINKNITKVGIIINHLEPFVLYLALLYYIPNNIKPWINYYMLFYLIVTIFYTISVFTNECTLIKYDTPPYIFWSWNNTNKYSIIYYLYFLLTLCILIYHVSNDKRKTIYSILYSLILFLVSFVFYEDKKPTGSIWCFIAAFIPYIILLTKCYNEHTEKVPLFNIYFIE
jgi:hypothetical protein